MAVQIATRVDEKQAELFRQTTKRLGTTPADALRMFISTFNDHRGFPYEVRLPEADVEPFSTEDEATEYITRLSLKAAHETR